MAKLGWDPEVGSGAVVGAERDHRQQGPVRQRHQGAAAGRCAVRAGGAGGPGSAGSAPWSRAMGAPQLQPRGRVDQVLGGARGAVVAVDAGRQVQAASGAGAAGGATPRARADGWQQPPQGRHAGL
eukprot:1043494-Alexandrium_andersonii.AAC.1